MRSPYEVLGVSPNARPAAVKRAYRKLASAAHPDRNPGDPDAERRSREINAAWAVLSDPERRKRYDETGRDAVPQPDGADGLTAILVPHLFAIMQNVPRESLERLDVAAELRKRIQRDAAVLADSLVQMRAAADKIDTVLSRLSVTGACDVFAGPLESERSRVENAIADAETQRTKLERAGAYLRGTSYRINKDGTVGSSPGPSFIISQFSWRT